MALLFMDGFDKYGPSPNSTGTTYLGLLLTAEWTTATGTGLAIAAPLSLTGQALLFNGSVSTLTKTLANYPRLIGGVRFSSNLVTNCGINFLDAGTAQVGIGINTTGTISVRNGTFSAGTVIATSTATVAANSIHYLEWDITFGNVGVGSYQVWLDGVSILSGTADTTATANAFANQFQLGSTGAGLITWDDLYLFDNTGSTNNAVLLTSPRIETQFPIADSAVQFAAGAGVVGSSNPRVFNNIPNAANQLRLRMVTPSVNCTLNSISFFGGAVASATVQLRPVVYANSGTVPGALLGSGSTVTGNTALTAKVLPLTTPISLSAGTTYWIGLMTDISAGNIFHTNSTATDDFIATSTFASGAPGTAPVMTATSSSMIWGNVTIAGANWYLTGQNPPQGNNSYVSDATVGHEDLYTFPALSTPPSAIYAVAVKANVAKSDAGAKTFSVRMKSVAADSPGSVASIAPGTSYGWATSLFAVDPNTSAAWTNAALAVATAGVKVET
jgi:hypothetical protein